MSASDDEEEYAYDSYSDDGDVPMDAKNDMSYEEEDEAMDWADNPNAAPVKGDSASGIRMLNSKELYPEMTKRVRDVCEVLDMDENAGMALLRRYKFNKEVLLEAYYADSEAVLKECGVETKLNAPAKSSSSGPRTTRASSKQMLCDICYDYKSPSEMWSMSCQHAFCVDCWKDFCHNMLMEGVEACLSKTCPNSECHEVVLQNDFESVADPQDAEKYREFQLRMFVERNDLTRWCPGKGCDKIACASNATAKEQEGGSVECDGCHTLFCLSCGEEPHMPSACPELLRWREKCRNESETANWILANTKPCPKCSSRIEKNQGCNHMTCQRCRHEFCWICCGEWHNHGANTGGYYKCNKFDNSSGGDESDAAKAKRELDRYLHFYKRYAAHDQAQKFAKKQLKDTEARMVLLQESSEYANAKWTDVEFLKTANEQLVECRRVLKYTYVFAYYLTDESKKMQKERFEHHQEMLERFTENLSELSEKPLNEMDRTDVVNQTRVVDRFMKNILKYVEDGMEEVTS